MDINKNIQYSKKLVAQNIFSVIGISQVKN
jgi:hypothetical protein